MGYNDEMKECFRERLKKVIGKKFETTMIASLSNFEEAFGYLWCQNKNADELTDNEKLFREKWEQVRNSILDVGHKQRRNAEKEIDMHEVEWKRYRSEFLPIRNNKENK